MHEYGDMTSVMSVEDGGGDSVCRGTRRAIEALEVSADVSRVGPLIVLLRSRGVSDRAIAKRAGVSNKTVKAIHARCIQEISKRLAN